MTETTSLAALLRVDQQARWQLGDRVRVEELIWLNDPEMQHDPGSRSRIDLERIGPKARAG